MDDVFLIPICYGQPQEILTYNVLLHFQTANVLHSLTLLSGILIGKFFELRVI